MMKESYFRLILITTASLYHVCSGIKNPLKEGYGPDHSCGEFPAVLDGQIEYRDIYAFVKCNKGFELKGDENFKCDQHSGSKWSPGTRPTCQQKDECPIPPLNHADIMRREDRKEAVLYCRDGYVLKSLAEPFGRSFEVYCYKDVWYLTPGVPVRDCVKRTAFLDDKCEQPPKVPHAKWIYEPDEQEEPPFERFSFAEGDKIQYYCETGYKLIGEPTVVCQEKGRWSDLPICLQTGTSEPCQVPIIPNGECSCWTTKSSSCTHVYHLGRVACTCDSGYQSLGQEVLTCNNGKWDRYTPSCISLTPTEVSVEDTTQDNSHMNTLAVVIATACSVLGLLLMVMVIVILRRKKPSHHHHQRFYDQGTMPPPYGRVYPIDEHDRVALIGYESARLPTYEEATSDTASQQVASPRSAQEFRPLPNIPFQLRSPALPSIDSTSRHSVITTTTGNAEVFGSIDTVNFSMSDASTAGTVDTMDSRTSRPSHGSRTATAGSLESSRENLSSEDAPLLENNTLQLNTETQDEVIEEENKES